MFDPNSIQKDLKAKAVEQGKKLTRQGQRLGREPEEDLNFAPSGGVIRRLVAIHIDYAISAAIFIFFLSTFQMYGISSNQQGIILYTLLFIPTSVAMFFMSTTVGKMVMGLTVITVENGRRVKPLRGVLRETVGKLLSSIFLLGYIMIPFNTEKKGLHDKIFKTRVIVDPHSIYKRKR